MKGVKKKIYRVKFVPFANVLSLGERNGKRTGIPLFTAVKNVQIQKEVIKSGF